MLRLSGRAVRRCDYRQTYGLCATSASASSVQATGSSARRTTSRGSCALLARDRHAWVVGRQPRSLGSRGQRSAESCVPLQAAPCSGYGTGQETAAFISPATFCSTAGLHVCSANDTGHRSPSSRFAASWNSSVEYRVLNLPEFLKQTTTLPSALA